MNKKMLGICLAAAVISTGTLGGVVASEVADRSLMLANAETVSGEHLPLREQGLFTPGNAAYAAIIEDHRNYLGTSGLYFIYFYGQDESQNKTEAFAKLERVDNYDISVYTEGRDQKATLFETVVPENPSNWQGAIVLCSDSQDGGFPSNSNWRQTTDVKPDGEIDNKNCIHVKIEQNNEDKRDWYITTVEAVNRLNVWGGTTGFWGDTNNICDEYGNTDREQLATLWNNAELSFGKLGLDVQSYFSNFNIAEGLGSSQTNMQHLGSLAEKYDYLVRKYGFNDFAHRI